MLARRFSCAGLLQKVVGESVTIDYTFEVNNFCSRSGGLIYYIYNNIYRLRLMT